MNTVVADFGAGGVFRVVLPSAASRQSTRQTMSMLARDNRRPSQRISGRKEEAKQEADRVSRSWGSQLSQLRPRAPVLVHKGQLCSHPTTPSDLEPRRVYDIKQPLASCGPINSRRVPISQCKAIDICLSLNLGTDSNARGVLRTCNWVGLL